MVERRLLLNSGIAVLVSSVAVAVMYCHLDGQFAVGPMLVIGGRVSLEMVAEFERLVESGIVSCLSLFHVNPGGDSRGICCVDWLCMFVRSYVACSACQHE